MNINLKFLLVFLIAILIVGCEKKLESKNKNHPLMNPDLIGLKNSA